MADAPTDEKKTFAPNEAYGDDKEEAAYAHNLIERINDALKKREEKSLVTNGIPYSKAYVYNQQKGINYAPPRDPKDDREVSMGIVHEKIVGFAAIFLKYVFKRRVKCYDKDGKLIDRMGDFYDLAIEFSFRMEQFKKKIALIYWELFTQGNAFVLDEWEVKTLTKMDAYDEKGNKLDTDEMDYTFEFLDNLSYKEGDEYQTRRAVSRVLDGRMVIFSNPEIEEVQEMPMIALEQDLTRDTAAQMYDSLKRWKFVPSDRENLDKVSSEKLTLFNTERLSDPSKSVISHLVWDKEHNRLNLFLNGVMMLSRKTPFTLFYPRGNYPMSNVAAERLTGSIYARAIPAKTKFNADYIDWVLKILALKFEQGAIPAILAKGKYTLTRDIFRAGQVTHGVKKEDYEKADPDNKGVTNADFNFAQFIKGLIENATLNPTSSGELSPDATATEIAITNQNQLDKLAYLLDGIANGFMDMALRRAETIEAKYTIKQKETVVDGKSIAVYQNFNVNVGGVNHSVVFDDAMSDPNYGHDEKRNELFKESFKARKNGYATEFYIADPDAIRRGEHTLDIEIHPEKMKETDLQMTQVWNEFTQLINTFGSRLDMNELQKIYLETSGRPGELFKPEDVLRLEQMNAQQGAAEGAAPPAQPEKNAKNKALMGYTA